jgi:hypothetical protein
MTYPIPFTILIPLVLIDLIFEMNCLEYFD